MATFQSFVSAYQDVVLKNKKADDAPPVPSPGFWPGGTFIIRAGLLRQRSKLTSKVRYFSLSSDGMLSRGKTADSLLEPYLFLAAGVCALHKKKHRCLSITLPTKRLKLRASSPEEAAAWAADIGAILKGDTYTNPSPFKPRRLALEFDTGALDSSDDDEWATAEEEIKDEAKERGDCDDDDDDDLLPNPAQGDVAAAAASEANAAATSAYSDAEKASIAALRSEISAFAAASGGLAAVYAKDDDILWRFALAHNYDIGAAADMFRHSCTWKEEEFGMAEKWDEWRPNGPRRNVAETGLELEMWNSRSARARLGDELFYSGYIGTSSGLYPGSEGAPVIAERLGRVDLHGIAKSEATMDLVLSSYTIHLEETWRRALAAGPKKRALIIVDLAGLNRFFLWNVGLVKRITSVGPPNYPETCAKVYVLPFALCPLPSLIRPQPTTTIPSTAQNP